MAYNISKSSYIEKIQQLLYSYEPLKFSAIDDFEFVAALDFEATEYKALADRIRKDGISAIPTFNAEERGGEDLSVYKFSDQMGERYLVAIYDSDELWQDPQILDVFLVKDY